MSSAKRFISSLWSVIAASSLYISSALAFLSALSASLSSSPVDGSFVIMRMWFADI